MKYLSSRDMRALLHRVRDFIPHVWPHGPGGECEETSRLLVRIIGPQARLNCGTDWRRVPNARGGGTRQVDSGYRNKAGRWNSHYWVDVTVGQQIYIADLTADQFDGPEVVFCKAPNGSYCPNVPQVREMLSTSRGVISEVSGWYARWLAWDRDPFNAPKTAKPSSCNSYNQYTK